MSHHNHDHHHSEHQHDHDHGSGHQHHDSKQSKQSDICMVENRDAESNSKLDKQVIANHVWGSCRPGNKFMVKSPTVSVRRVQLMRAQLQFNPKEWENEPAPETPPSSPKKKPGCPCSMKGQQEGGGRRSSYSTNSSASDVVHSCPDECQGMEDSAKEEDDYC